MTDGGPVRAVEPLGATRTRFPARTGVEAPLAAANRSARALSPRGGAPVELALSGPAFAEELRKRGFDLSVRWQ